MRRRVALAAAWAGWAVLALAAIAGPPASAAAPAAPQAYDALHPLVLPPGAVGVVAADLPPVVLSRIRTASAADLRVFDAAGTPQPHALVRPPPTAARDITALQPLAIRGARLDASATVAGRQAPSGPLRLRIDQSGDGRTIEAIVDDAPAAPADAPVRSWLFDTRALQAPLAELEIDAVLPGGRIVGVALHASADLREWQPIATDSALYRQDADGGVRTERLALAEPQALRGRWLRIDLDDGTIKAARAATGVSARPGEGAVWLTLGAPRPGDAGSGRVALEWRPPFGLPIEAIELRPSRPDALATVRVMGRDRLGEPWRAMAEGVTYRLSRPGAPEAMSPALAVRASPVALLRVESDTPGFDTMAPQARVAVAPLRLVFVAGGTPPYRLAVGLDPGEAPRSAALPVASLVPGFRQGADAALPRAVVGDAPSRPPSAPWLELYGLRIDGRSALLWSALLGGVAALGWIAWQALRPAPPQPVVPPPGEPAADGLEDPDNRSASRARSASDRNDAS